MWGIKLELSFISYPQNNWKLDWRFKHEKKNRQSIIENIGAFSIIVMKENFLNDHKSQYIKKMRDWTYEKFKTS